MQTNYLGYVAWGKYVPIDISFPNCFEKQKLFGFELLRKLITTQASILLLSLHVLNRSKSQETIYCSCLIGENNA